MASHDYKINACPILHLYHCCYLQYYTICWSGLRNERHVTQYNDKTTSSRPPHNGAPALQRSHHHSGSNQRSHHNSDQLKKMKSKRPSSAPFVSTSLSVHGHLPSFAKRRPNTASLIQHRVEVSTEPEIKKHVGDIVLILINTHCSGLKKKQESESGTISSV